LQGFDEKTQEVDYEKKGEVYKDLVSLLREKSSQFAENIAKKVRKKLSCKTNRNLVINYNFNVFLILC